MEMRAKMDTQDQDEFDGIRIDTFANLKSIMSKDQYYSYCGAFGVRPVMRPERDRTVKGIGGSKRSIGMALIQIQFKLVGWVIDVEFLLLTEKIQTLTSIRDMLRNGLDLSLQ